MFLIKLVLDFLLKILMGVLAGNVPLLNTNALTFITCDKGT
jgi:hypothetical protein